MKNGFGNFNFDLLTSRNETSFLYYNSMIGYIWLTFYKSTFEFVFVWKNFLPMISILLEGKRWFAKESIYSPEKSNRDKINPRVTKLCRVQYKRPINYLDYQFPDSRLTYGQLNFPHSYIFCITNCFFSSLVLKVHTYLNEWAAWFRDNISESWIKAKSRLKFYNTAIGGHEKQRTELTMWFGVANSRKLLLGEPDETWKYDISFCINAKMLCSQRFCTPWAKTFEAKLNFKNVTKLLIKFFSLDVKYCSNFDVPGRLRMRLPSVWQVESTSDFLSAAQQPCLGDLSWVVGSRHQAIRSSYPGHKEKKF